MDLHEGDIDGVSIIARISEFEQCHVTDVVLIKYGDDLIAGDVWLHAAVAGQTYSAVSCMKTLNKEHRCALWLQNDNCPAIFQTGEIICCVIWESLCQLRGYAPAENWRGYAPAEI